MYVDYNILTPQQMDELLFSPFEIALGEETRERIRKQLENYDYYEGKQHMKDGRLVRPDELERPAGLDYDPTRFYTNYFKTFIQKKARWQMGGHHGITVEPKQLDALEDTIKPDYQPSEAQKRENKRAADYERLLNQLWKENRMREKLMQAAKDRLIAGRVGCKIVFNPRTGKIKWVFRPDTEIIPVYSDDDFEELLAVHFVQLRGKGDAQYIWKQTFSMEEDGFCYLEEAEFDMQLNRIRTITEKESMEIDFIPVVLFPIEDLTGDDVTNDEIDDMRQLTDVLNKLNEDAIDSLKFEMFPMTAFLGVPPGTTDKVNVAPGAMLEIAQQGMSEGMAKPDVKKIESGFTWGSAFDETYSRLKAALHEVTSIPNIVPQELNFGGLNGEALHVLFHSIIQETEEHWLVWGSRLAELHEKTVRYLQARLDRDVFGYDKEVVRAIGNDYDSTIKFQLPLPDNRKELVELLSLEVSSGFESLKGAMQRLGVENVAYKSAEIDNEKVARMRMADPYGDAVTSFAQNPEEYGAAE